MRFRNVFFGVDFFGVLMIVAAIFSMLGIGRPPEHEAEPVVELVAPGEADRGEPTDGHQ